jgi:hypothetical protein
MGVMVGQVTIYLDDATERLAREAAQAKGVPLSKWVAERVQSGARAEWPRAVLDLAGKWTDLEPADEIRARLGQDVSRSGF